MRSRGRSKGEGRKHARNERARECPVGPPSPPDPTTVSAFLLLLVVVFLLYALLLPAHRMPLLVRSSHQRSCAGKRQQV